MYLTLHFIVQIEHFDTYPTHPVVQSIDTMSFCTKKFSVNNPCRLKMAAVLRLSIFPAGFLLQKCNVCAIIFHLWIEATCALVEETA